MLQTDLNLSLEIRGMNQAPIDCFMDGSTTRVMIELSKK
jgi:hypothetical protein